MLTEVFKKFAHPKSLLISSEQFSAALSFHRYLIRFLQHLFKQILSGLNVTYKAQSVSNIRQFK